MKVIEGSGNGVSAARAGMIHELEGLASMIWNGAPRTAVYLWAAALLAATSSVSITAAQAQQSAQRQFTFNIPSKPVPQAVNDIGRVTGLSVVFPENKPIAVRSKPVQGSMTASQALSTLLAGTGLSYRFSNATTVMIVDPSAQAASGNGAATVAGAIVLDPITVQAASNPNSTMTPMPAYAGGQVATGGQVGMLGNRSVMNTPFSITSYTNKVIEDQQARTVQDVLNNDPSVVASTSNGTKHDYQVIRGFGGYSTDGTRTLNGVPGMAPMSFPSSDYIERVEILKGPSTLLNGMSLSSAAVTGALGGSVNLVTKRATNEPITQLTTRYVSNAQFGTHLDVGRRFGVGNEFGIRFNGSIDGGHTPIDKQRSELGTAALNLDYSGQRVRLSADLAHQTQELDPSGVYVNARNIAGSATSFPVAPDSKVPLVPWSEFRTNSTMGMIRGEVDLFENVTAYAAIGKQNAKANLNGFEKARLLDVTGQYSIAPEQQRYVWDSLSMQGGIRAKADTGPVNHALSLNLSQSELTYKLAESQGATSTIASIYNPVFPAISPAADPGAPKKSSDLTVSSIGFADTLSVFNERIQLTAGVRHQEVGISNFTPATGLLRSEYSASAWTPAYALVVKPWENVSLYANYIEDLRSGAIVGTAYANSGQMLPPYVSKQHEAGVKVDWGRVTTTAAVFQIAKAASIEVDNPGGALPTLSQDGEERNRGIEFNAYGELTPGVRLMGGLTFIDARLVNTERGLLDGKRGDTAPNVRAVIGAEWDAPFMAGLTLTGRLTHTGETVVFTSSGVTIPSWTTADLGARYTFNSPWNEKPVTVRVNVDNVFDKDYWAGTYAAGFVYQGQPRTFRLSATVNF